MDYVRAVAALYQAPHGEFVAERKRLAAELKATGDREGAKTLAKLGRPPISAWAVNQLYWHAREAFDRLMATAAQLREGDLSANGPHREALGKLRQRAASFLTDAGHNANEATLRRTAQTLSAIAALGTFAPDPAGALSDDRDPPGFEAAGIVVSDRPAPMLSVAPPAADEPLEDDDDGDGGDGDDDTPEVSSEEREVAAALLQELATAKPARHLASVPSNVRAPDDTLRGADSNVRGTDGAKRARHLSAVPFPAPAESIAAVRETAAAEAERAAAAVEAERMKRRARERDRIATALRTARGEVDTRRRAADAMRAEIARADGAVADAVAIVADLEAALAELTD